MIEFSNKEDGTPFEIGNGGEHRYRVRVIIPQQPVQLGLEAPNGILEFEVDNLKGMLVDSLGGRPEERLLSQLFNATADHFDAGIGRQPEQPEGAIRSVSVFGHG